MTIKKPCNSIELTLTVSDPDSGAAQVGVPITIGGSSKSTNSSGQVSFTISSVDGSVS